MTIQFIYGMRVYRTKCLICWAIPFIIFVWPYPAVRGGHQKGRPTARKKEHKERTRKEGAGLHDSPTTRLHHPSSSILNRGKQTRISKILSIMRVALCSVPIARLGRNVMLSVHRLREHQNIVRVHFPRL